MKKKLSLCDADLENYWVGSYCHEQACGHIETLLDYLEYNLDNAFNNDVPPYRALVISDNYDHVSTILDTVLKLKNDKKKE